jgi:serine/threonine-protein kinase
MELNPNLALAYDQLAWVHVCLGRYDQAIAETRRALELDPLSPLINAEFAIWLMRARRYDEAIAQARKALELNAGSAAAYRAMGWSRFWNNAAAGTIAEFEKMVSLGDTARRRSELAYAHAAAGDRVKAEAILREFERLSAQRYVSPGAFAVVYLGLGESNQALEWLEKAYDDQDDVCWRLKCDRIFDPIRSEPRFQALLKKVGLDK